MDKRVLLALGLAGTAALGWRRLRSQAAPAVLGYVDTPAEASDRITGPIVVTFAFLGAFAITQGCRWVNLAAAAWLLIGPWFLEGPTTFRVSSVVVGVLLLVLTPLGDPQPELASEPVPVGADGILPVAHVRAEVERGVGVDAGAAVPVGHGPLHAVAVAGGLQPLAPGEHEELPPHLRKSGTSRSSESSKVTWRGGCWPRAGR